MKVVVIEVKMGIVVVGGVDTRSGGGGWLWK